MHTDENYATIEDTNPAPHHDGEMPTVHVWPIAANPGIEQERDVDGPDYGYLYARCFDQTYHFESHSDERYFYDPSRLFERVLRAYCGTTTFHRYEIDDDYYYTFDTDEWRGRTGRYHEVTAAEDFADYRQWRDALND